MRKVTFDPERLTAEEDVEFWRTWKAKADAATAEAISAWEERKENLPRDGYLSAVWGELKQWLNEKFFHGLCGYCQTPSIGYYPQAEHFRPKGRVSIADQKGIRAVVRLAAELDPPPHPGYFWLAYTWQNLVPCCAWCNNRKSDLFPVAKSHLIEPVKKAAGERTPELAPYRSKTRERHYYLLPEELDRREGRLLLNPLFDDPRTSIAFQPGGFIEALDDRGTKTIEAFGLDDERLRVARQAQQDNLRRQFYGAASNVRLPDEKLKACREVLAPYLAGKEAFSEAALDYLTQEENPVDVRAKYA